MINKVLQILHPGYVRPQIKTLNRRLHEVIKTESQMGKKFKDLELTRVRSRFILFLILIQLNHI